MQLIPVLVPGKMKTMEASQHFLDVREDTASMAEAIKKPKRTFPYILQIGESFTIIVSGKPFISASSSTDALLDLFCFHYVFHMDYSTEVKPSFLLIQREVMGKQDSDTENCKNLALFVRHLEHFRNVRDDDEMEDDM